MGFLAWLLPLIAKLGLDWWTHRGPAPIVVEAEKAGAADDQAAGAEEALKTETAVAQAETSAPATQGAIADVMDKGAF